MIEQQGQIVRYAKGRGWVRMGAQSGCPACDAGKGCGAGVFSRLLAKRPVTLELDLPRDLSVGESVVVGLPERVFLGMISRLYLWPLLAGLAGAFIGHNLLGVFDSVRLTDLGALAGAIAAGGLMMKWNARRLKEFPRELIVHFIRVGGTDEDMACEGILTDRSRISHG